MRQGFERSKIDRPKLRNGLSTALQFSLKGGRLESDLVPICLLSQRLNVHPRLLKHLGKLLRCRFCRLLVKGCC